MIWVYLEARNENGGPRSACGSKELISPFPVSPSGGKPGRAGSPHAGSTSHASKKRWHVPMLPAPPTRGASPPCAIPLGRTTFSVDKTGLLMEDATERSG